MRQKRFNRLHRIIHWAIAFTILFMLMTILLRIGWMNKDHVGGIIQEQLGKSGKEISLKDAALIGKEVRRPMWNWHVRAGYVLIGLYIIRLIITATQGIAFKGPFSRDSSTKDKFKAWVYIVFYILMGASLFTGFMTVNGPKDLRPTMSFIHMKSLYYLVTFIIIHFGGVLLADFSTEKGIISKMISGDK